MEELRWEQTDQNAEFAHYAIEVAMDLLLKMNDDRKLGKKLLKADLLRSWQDRFFLVKVFVWKGKRTDWLTLATTELTFRNLIARYAMALVLPGPLDKKALAELGAQLAWEMYGIEVSPEELQGILEHAIELCENDYKDVIDHAIQQIEDNF